MTRRCNRCDFTTDDATALVEHARDAAHPLCIRCARSLRGDETQTCARCVADVRADLTRIVELYQLLPAELPHHADAQIPGGDALVMLAPGSAGDQAVYGRHHGQACWCGHSHHADALPSDPESVVATLALWEDDWRHIFGQRASQQEATVTETAAYLNTHLHLAAKTHPAFDEFADDMRRLLIRVELTTATADWPLTGAPCLDCGRHLERDYAPGGLSDVWHCPRCRRRYTHAEYLLAMRAELEQRRRDAGEAIHTAAGWGLPWQVAATLGLPVETVRTWAKRLQIGARCDVESGALEVSWTDAHDRVSQTGMSATA